jgi:catechol 2,3-dioxygenase-like lactoylglutathione lyase family enzyme
MVSAMTHVTVGVTDLDAAIGLFSGVMGLRVEIRRSLAAAECKAWHLDTAQAEMAELSCAGYPIGRLRLLTCTPQTPERVRDDHGGGDSGTDIGPKAIDFYVSPPIEEYVAELEANGCIPRSPPVRHETEDYDSEELVLSGPDGLPMLIMVGHRHHPSQIRKLPPGTRYSEIATVSVVCGDLAENRRFYGDVLGLGVAMESETLPEFQEDVANLTGVAKGSRIHFLVYQDPAEPSGKILLVHFFQASRRRLVGRMRPGRLGVVLYSHHSDDVDGLHNDLSAAGYEIVTPPTTLDAPGASRRILLARGPNEELFEFHQTV